jgi:hypothetical protein
VLLIRLDAGMCEMKCFTPDGLDVLLIPLDVGICKMNYVLCQMGCMCFFTYM